MVRNALVQALSPAVDPTATAGESIQWPTDEPVAGLYVHIPYCRHRCPYCSFNVWVDPKGSWEVLIEATLSELEARAAWLTAPLRSVYFGGGTPSLAPIGYFERVLSRIEKLCGTEAKAEITFEVEPATAGRDTLHELRKIGINRVSIGWQSTHDAILKRLGRGHRAHDGQLTVSEAREAGFENLSVDLIFAVPGQRLAELEIDLERLIALQPQHVSLYALTIELGTEFDRRVRRGLLRLADDELELAMMERIDQELSGAGFRGYEVSNYARYGFQAVHNSLYWSGAPYLGIGPGAHSFLPAAGRALRFEGHRRSEDYLGYWMTPSRRPGRAPAHARIDADSVDSIEIIDERMVIAERFMTGCRLSDGIDLESLGPWSTDAEIVRGMDTAEARGWGARRGSRFIPTRLGRRYADSMALLFFPDPQPSMRQHDAGIDGVVTGGHC